MIMSISINLSPGVPTYSFEREGLRVSTVTLKLDDETHLVVSITTEEHITYLREGKKLRRLRGTPVYCCITEDTITFYPMPDKTYKATMTLFGLSPQERAEETKRRMKNETQS